MDQNWLKDVDLTEKIRTFLIVCPTSRFVPEFNLQYNVLVKKITFTKFLQKKNCEGKFVKLSHC